MVVEGLEFYGFHGVSDEERTLGHRFTLDVRIEVEGSADETDDIAQTVDYSELTRALLDIGENTSVLTVEKLARMMAEEVFRRFRLVTAAELQLMKVAPPMPCVVARVGVVSRFER